MINGFISLAILIAIYILVSELRRWNKFSSEQDRLDQEMLKKDELNIRTEGVLQSIKNNEEEDKINGLLQGRGSDDE